MSAVTTVSQSRSELLCCLVELASYAVLFISACVAPQAQAAATIVALSSQWAACTQGLERTKEPRPRSSQAFRVLRVIRSRVLEGWGNLAQLMKPATVKRGHKQGWRLDWRWKPRSRGRPPFCTERQQLVCRMSREHPLWSAERIGDTMRLLGYDPPCDDTIRKYMARPRKPREPSTTWLPFLRNHLGVSWAIDFFMVTTLSFAAVDVFLVFEDGRRRAMHWATTRSPSMEWVIQQLREAMPFGQQPRYPFRDSDGIYGHGVALFLGHRGSSSRSTTTWRARTRA